MMSGALDELTADEKALFDSMRATDDSGAPPPAPAADQAPAQQPVQQPDPAVAKDPEAQKTVPKGALDEERSRRKAAEKAAREREMELAKVNTRFEMLTKALEANAAPAAQETPAPAFDSDPKAWIEHNFREFRREQEAFRRQQAELIASQTQNSEQQRQMQAIQELQSWGASQEAEFARNTPDYPAAVEHLRASKEAELRAIGFEDPVQIAGMIRQAVINTADVARRNGRNFAEVLYATSKAAGYRPGNGVNGTDNPLAPSRTPSVSVDSAAERLIRGNDMATTLGSTGAAPRGEPAPKVIADMSDSQFEALMAKIEKMPPEQRQAAKRNLFGA